MSRLSDLEQELQALADSAKAQILMRFFKTGPGQYGAGDCFLGIQTPPQRALAKQFRDLALDDLSSLLKSQWHEYRLTGLLIATLQYPKNREAIYTFLCEQRAAMNNWDLVDVIVPATIGDYLWRYPEARGILEVWIQSDNLWERRIALLASLGFIRKGETELTIHLAETVLQDREDLIHKASGWMLREAGQKDLSVLLDFLERHSVQMPRTMLRYAIEKLSPEQRRDYLGRRQLKKPVLE